MQRRRKSKLKSSKSQTLILIAVLILGLVFSFDQFSNTQASNSKKTPAVKCEKIEGIEIPEKIANRNEIFITHSGFSVSYNSDWKIPNWVAYELTDEEVAGEEPRNNRFEADPNLKSKQSATDYDYRNSGFDPGHMAPAADMKWSKQAMKESFYFSNICPQNHNLNAGVWKSLEEQVRDIAAEKGSLYVVCGPIVAPNYQTIGDNKVVVPQQFFKALLQNYNNEWHAIAFVFDNKSGKRPLSTYALSIKELEEITGITFFPSLNKKIAKNVKSQVDFAQWTVSRK